MADRSHDVSGEAPKPAASLRVPGAICSSQSVEALSLLRKLGE
jgi:hypothetical protein